MLFIEFILFFGRHIMRVLELSLSILSYAVMSDYCTLRAYTTTDLARKALSSSSLQLGRPVCRAYVQDSFVSCFRPP